MAQEQYQTDVALLSVTTTEFSAVMHFHNWKAKTIFGDDQVYDVASFERDGKKRTLVHAKIRFGDLGFLPRSTSLSIPTDIVAMVREALDSPENPCRVHIGPMACGSTVVASRELLEKQIYSQYQHTAGLDMESYAVVYAAYHAKEPRPVPLIIKSVCDFADNQKSDDYQRFAAYSSCEFAQFLYEKVLPLD